jgi:hypothetical protein
MPEMTAASTQPPSIPLLVQSPASVRFVKPDSPDGRRCSTDPAGVSTYCSQGVTFARQYCESKRAGPAPPSRSTSTFQSNAPPLAAFGQSTPRSFSTKSIAFALTRSVAPGGVSSSRSSRTPQK